ncbi:MAG: glycoside hydrolase family 5 protein [Acidobacteriota bacterium]
MSRSTPCLVILFLVSMGIGTAAGGASMVGVNLAGAEFDHGTFWPTSQEIDYFLGKGMNTIRVPFRWERLQPSLGGDLDAAQLAGLDGAVNEITAKGGFVILDPHNYARYNGQLIGSPSVSNADFADLWTRLATRYRSNERVLFGLMNEPHSMPTEQWVAAANAAIAAIRGAGATQTILVPGNAWTGAHSWTQNWYGTSNSVAMLDIVDPGSNFIFELHQYFDGDFSGTSPTCTPGTGSAQLMAVTAWLETHGHRGLLGEFAGADNGPCRDAIENALSFVASHPQQWAGWTWWAAGPEWGEYIFTLEPTGNFTVDRPQMAWLEPFLGLFADGFETGGLSAWDLVEP